VSVPLVTIGMPVFDGAAHVEDAVRSLLAQTVREFVLVISDDGSRDETAAICDRLAAEDPRVRFVAQDAHLGMTRNFRFVLHEATTPYFLWAAQDDTWEPAFLEETLALLRGHPDAVGAMTGIRFIDARGEAIRSVRIPRELASSDPAVRAAAVRRNGFHAIYALFERERLLATGVDLEDVPAPDVAFVFGLVLHRPIAATDRELSTRRDLGYERVISPEGRVVWAKAMGPDGRLYAWSRTELARALRRHVRSAPLDAPTRARVIASVGRISSWGVYRNLVEQTGELPIRSAWRERRYVRATLLAAAQLALRPRRVMAEAVRRWRER